MRPAHVYSFATAAGVAGGFALMAMSLSRIGWLILIPYITMMLLLAIWYLRVGVASFALRVKASLFAFMLATLIADGFVIVVRNPAAMRLPLWAHVWPMGVMLLIGMAASAVVARLSEPPRWARSAPGVNA